MSNWRRQKPRYNSNNYNPQRGTKMTQSSSKPPLANCRLSVPAWEKDFCAEIGSVPWWKVVEAKQFMHIYDRVVQWDDSAGEDAFKNAKSRFWAKINGFTCDLTLPDPDVYIDDVDWDAEVDTELILDLERGVERDEDEHVVILDALVLSGQYSGSGWGTGWGDAEGINEENFGKPDKSWNDEKCDGWNEDSWGRKEKTETWDHNNNLESWDHKNNFKTESWDHKNNNLESWDQKKKFKTESWDHNNNLESWDQKNNFKTESWDHKNNNLESWDQKNNFKTESWNHKNSNSFNHKKVENWNSRDQRRESRGWRKRGEVGQGGDRVEDCRWRNGRGRSRGGFQQRSNGWGVGLKPSEPNSVSVDRHF